MRILSWSDAVTAGPARAGGKGWNLGRLHRYGFAVPRGFVIDATANRDGVDPASLREEVEEALASRGLLATPVAVRSSATSEDGVERSFAVHESVLRVRGIDAILAAIRTCYASLDAPRAVAYRERAGIAREDVHCAVVVCEMIPHRGMPRAAGVAFSADPRDGRRDRVVMNAAAGAGEDVVSGRVSPEELLVADGAIAARRGPRTLSDAEALEIARVTERIAWALGDGDEPQDVEWVHDGAKLWIVQARPVTALPHRTFAALADVPPIWSNANLQDALPGVLTTATYDNVRSMIRRMLLVTQESAGYEMPAGMHLMRRFAGRAYFELAAMQWAFYDAFGVTPAETNASIGGHQPEIDVPPHPLDGKAGGARKRRSLKLLRVLTRARKDAPAAIAALRGELAHWTQDRVRVMSDRELLDALRRITASAHRFAPVFQLTNAGPGVWQTLLHRQLAPLFGDRATAIASGLVSGGGRVTSAEQAYELYDLADIARREGRDSDAFRFAFVAYLATYGHRAVYEGELANPRWAEEPSYLLAMIDAIAATPPPVPPRELARARRAAAEAEVRRATWMRRPFIRWAARRFQASMALREETKSELVRVAVPARAIALEAGRRFVERGWLDDGAGIFELAAIELEALLSGEWEGIGARELVADRIAQRDAWRREEPPDVIIDRDAHGIRLAAPVDDADGWRGVGAASGQATGRAIVIHHPAEGDRLHDGDVLVAPSTDPGWTPLFLRAAAIVTETGGYLSHGAIVAREFGIPAVVNVRGIIVELMDGEPVVVDGDRGVVRRA